MKMQKYVLGFAFTEKDSSGNFQVALIEKLKPDWQKGLLNGIGGKIETGEYAEESMSREFLEETGVYISKDEWIRVGRMQEEHNFCVYVFAYFGEKSSEVKTVEKEKVLLLDPIKNMSYLREKAISNVPWLIFSCLDADVLKGRCNIVGNYE